MDSRDWTQVFRLVSQLFCPLAGPFLLLQFNSWHHVCLLETGDQMDDFNLNYFHTNWRLENKHYHWFIDSIFNTTTSKSQNEGRNWALKIASNQLGEWLLNVNHAPDPCHVPANKGNEPFPHPSALIVHWERGLINEYMETHDVKETLQDVPRISWKKDDQWVCGHRAGRSLA